MDSRRSLDKALLNIDDGIAALRRELGGAERLTQDIRERLARAEEARTVVLAANISSVGRQRQLTPTTEPTPEVPVDYEDPSWRQMNRQEAILRLLREMGPTRTVDIARLLRERGRTGDTRELVSGALSHLLKVGRASRVSRGVWYAVEAVDDDSTVVPIRRSLP